MFQKLNADKYNALFRQINKSSPLKILNVPGNNLSKVNPELFGSAVSKLTSVDLNDTNVSREMLTNLFDKISRVTADTMSPLRCLNIAHNNELKHVNPDLMASALCQLETINIKMTSISETHVSRLLETRVSSDTSPLARVNMAGVINLSKVDPDLLATFLTKLKQATIYATKLTPMQLTHTLQTLTASDHNLSLLDIGGSNFSSIPPNLISDGIKNIENVNLYFTKLTTNQKIHILQHGVLDNSSKLKHLDMGGNTSNIPEHLLDMTKNMSKIVKLA